MGESDASTSGHATGQGLVGAGLKCPGVIAPSYSLRPFGPPASQHPSLGSLARKAPLPLCPCFCPLSLLPPHLLPSFRLCPVLLPRSEEAVGLPQLLSPGAPSGARPRTDTAPCSPSEAVGVRAALCRRCECSPQSPEDPPPVHEREGRARGQWDSVRGPDPALRLSARPLAARPRGCRLPSCSRSLPAGGRPYTTREMVPGSPHRPRRAVPSF